MAEIHQICVLTLRHHLAFQVEALPGDFLRLQRKGRALYRVEEGTSGCWLFSVTSKDPAIRGMAVDLEFKS